MVRDFPELHQCGSDSGSKQCVFRNPRVNGHTFGAETEAEAREKLSRVKLRCVRPGDTISPLKRASYDYSDNSGMMMPDIEEDQGELFPVDADDEAYDWDEAEDDGIAPRVVRDVKNPTAQEMEEHNCTHIPSQPWCPACVAGKKPNSPHKRQTEGEHLVP